MATLVCGTYMDDDDADAIAQDNQDAKDADDQKDTDTKD